MRSCGWYLWLNGKKIQNIRELRENFDTAVLIGYFLGGSLMKWLSDLGEPDIVKHLSGIDMNGDIGSQLEFAFGVSPDKNAVYDRSEPPCAEIPVSAEAAAAAGITETAVFTSSFYGAAGSFDSIFAGSYGSIIASSFGVSLSGLIPSSGMSSGYNLSSYSAFLTGQVLSAVSSAGSFSMLFNAGLTAFGTGSFTFSAGSVGSGGSGMLFGRYGNVFGSFGYGSYKGFYAGSFGLSLLSGLLSGSGGSFGSFGSFGNIGGFFGEGSFRRNAAGVTITAEEYHRTLINLSSCPLNAYGYGINLI